MPLTFKETRFISTWEDEHQSKVMRLVGYDLDGEGEEKTETQVKEIDICYEAKRITQEIIRMMEEDKIEKVYSKDEIGVFFNDDGEGDTVHHGVFSYLYPTTITHIMNIIDRYFRKVLNYSEEEARKETNKILYQPSKLDNQKLPKGFEEITREHPDIRIDRLEKRVTELENKYNKE